MPSILTVSKLKDWKRVDRAIRVMPAVLHAVPDACLNIVGDGQQKIQLATLATQLNVQKNVIFHGAKPHSEVGQYFKEADVFLSLYDFSNLCSPLEEAMLYGKAIITIDDKSTDELLTNEWDCIKIRREELGGRLASEIVRLLRDKELRDLLGKRAKQTANVKLISWSERMAMEVKHVERARR
jgi:glycosyltransferase involved in cell wall biosynthesis